LPAIQEYWDSNDPSVEQFLAIEESTVLHQIQQWKAHGNNVLSDLATRFMERNRFAMIEPPEMEAGFSDTESEWWSALKDKVKSLGYEHVDMCCLRDELKAKYYQPYFPEKESDEQSAKNAIRIIPNDGGDPVEISVLLDRLKPITAEKRDRYRYYVPAEVRDAAEKLRREWRP
jgi:hypothetical protein